MKNFWKELKKPFFCLAPMYDVTDAAFRRMFAKYGKFASPKLGEGGPDVMFTEFFSADGLIHEKGRESVLKHLIYSEEERPIVAQIFGSNPESMEEASRIVQEMGFDGIDINMGCPDKNINKQGSGAELINNPELAIEIIRAVKIGAPNIPVSVKTRTGYNKNETEEWIPILLKENISALTIHARTRKEMSKVPADWSKVKKIVDIRNEMGVDTLIIGNGDVSSMEEAGERVKETNCDGVMIGRGAFGNPWLFSEYKPSIKEKLKVLMEHTKLFEKLLPNNNFSIMKKHFKAYVSGFDDSKELRVKLMETNNSKEVEEIIEKFLISNY